MSSVIVYKAREGSHINDNDAKVIGGFLAKKFGEEPVTPEQVVASARSSKSPIHGYFEWDDTVAAGAYRRVQARDYLGAIQVVYRDERAGERVTRAYHNVVVSVGEERERAYVPQQVVWQKPDMAAQVLAQAAREQEQWAKRYAQYAELADEVRAARSMAERIRQLPKAA